MQKFSWQWLAIGIIIGIIITLIAQYLSGKKYCGGGYLGYAGYRNYGGYGGPYYQRGGAVSPGIGTDAPVTPSPIVTQKFKVPVIPPYDPNTINANDCNDLYNRCIASGAARSTCDRGRNACASHGGKNPTPNRSIACQAYEDWECWDSPQQFGSLCQGLGRQCNRDQQSA